MTQKERRSSSSNMQRSQDNQQIIRNTMTISVFNGLGLVSALALDVLLAARLGLGHEMDALYVALTLPQLIFAILFVSCRAVLVPSFSRARAEASEERAWQLYRMTITAALLLFGALAVAGVLAAPLLVSLLAPGLAAASRALTVRLARICFWLVLPSGVIQSMSAMLNVHRRFAVPAALNAVQYTVVMATAVLGLNRWGIEAVAGGYVIAALAQWLMLGAAIHAIGGRYRPELNLHDPELRHVARLLGPLLLQGAASQGSILAERVVGSFLPPGSITALSYARRVLRAVSDIFLDSVATALLPRLATLSAAGDVLGLKRAMGFGARLTLLISVPAVAWLSALNVPIIRLTFQRGAFDVTATSLTAGIMALYVLSVPPMAVLQVVTDTFFALRDTLTPLYVRLFTLAANLLLDVALVSMFGAHGLALALLLARCAGLALGAWWLRRRIGALGLAEGGLALKLGLATAALVATSRVAFAFFGPALPHGLVQRALALGAASALGLAAFLVVAILARIEEVDTLRSAVQQRLSRRSVTSAG